MVSVETDGRKVHAGDPFFDNDRIRWNWIENRGWSQLRFTWRQMYDEAYVIGTIRERLFALRGRSLPAVNDVMQ
jgi:very-short-patch-repair endonuclease